MTIDTQSPFAPAQVRGLIIPSGRIRKSKFNDFCSYLQCESRVKLGNVRPSPRSERTIFSPQNAPGCTVLFELSPYLPPVSQLALSPFELFREPLVVIGILDSSEYSCFRSTETQKNHDAGNIHDGVSPSETLDNALLELKENYSKALVHYLLLLGIEKDEGLSQYPRNVRAMPSALATDSIETREFFLELTSLLLDGMVSYSKTIQALPTIPSPKFSSAISESDPAPGWPTGQDYGMMHSDESSASSKPMALTEKITLTHPLSITSNQTGKSNSKGSAKIGQAEVAPHRPEYKVPATTFEEMNDPSISISSASQRSVAAPKSIEAESKKINVQGFGSGSLNERVRDIGQARISAVVGQLLLVSGHWSEALNETLKSVVKCKFFDEYLWYAKGLETILVCLLMQVWAGHALKIPHLCYPEADRFGIYKAVSMTGNEDFNASKAATLEAATTYDLAILLPGLLNKILNLYMQASESTGGSVPQTVFSECVIRFTKILIALSICHGEVGSDMLHKLLTNQIIARPQATTVNNQTSAPGKDEIVRFLFQAIPANAAASQHDNIAILCGMSLALSSLGAHRKKAFILRELSSSIVSALIESRRAEAARMGMHPAANVLANFQDIEDSHSRVEGRSSDERLEYLMRYLARLYGIRELDYSAAQPSESISALESRISSLGMSRQSGNFSLKLSIIRLCIDFCEALPYIRGIGYFSALLLAQYGSWSPNSITDDLSVIISNDEQLYLATNIRKLAKEAEATNSDDIEVDYWDDLLLQEVRIADERHVGVPLSLNKLNKPSSISGLGNNKNPFIYSNISKRKLDSTPHLLAGEQCEFYVTLRNLYAFELTVLWLELCSAGAKLESRTENIRLPPFATERLSIKATPKEAGELRVEGCKIKVFGCRARQFYIFPQDWYSKAISKIKSIAPRASIPGPGSSDASANLQSLYHDLFLDLKSLSIKVIPKQPTVVAKDISIPRAALILFEGEATNISVTLYNISEDVPVNYIATSCHDSISTALESSSTERQILTPDSHEKQLLLHKRPISNVLDKPDVLSPGQSKSCNLAFIGVKDLTAATIQIDYAHVIEEDVETTEVFAKRLELPLAVTVIPNIRLCKASLLALPPRYPLGKQTSASQSNEKQNVSLNEDFEDVERDKASDKTTKWVPYLNGNVSKSELCMLVLDFQNLWSHPLHVSLVINSKEIGDVAPTSKTLSIMEDIVDPGDLSRLTVVLPKIYIQNPYAPIPSVLPIEERQFVRKIERSQHEVSPSDLKAFWYREKLLNSIRGSWKDEASGRSGDIDLRKIHLGPEMIDVLSLDDIDIDVGVFKEIQDEDEKKNDMVDDDDGCHDDNDTIQRQQQERRQEKFQQLSHSRFIIPTNTLFILRISLFNRSSSPIHPLLRLQPRLAHQDSKVAVDLDRCLVFGGTMQRVLTVLGPGESLMAEVSFCALTRGTYDIGATVEEVRRARPDRGVEADGNGIGHVGHTDGFDTNFAADAGGVDDENAEGRRTWHMREPCRVIAV